MIGADALEMEWVATLALDGREVGFSGVEGGKKEGNAR